MNGEAVQAWEINEVIAVCRSRAISLEDAWAVLAAARPAIEREAKAAAWDEGFDAGHQAARAVNPERPEVQRNPYRAGAHVSGGFDGSRSGDWTAIRLEAIDGHRFTPTYGEDNRPAYWRPEEWLEVQGRVHLQAAQARRAQPGRKGDTTGGKQVSKLNHDKARNQLARDGDDRVATVTLTVDLTAFTDAMRQRSYVEPKPVTDLLATIREHGTHAENCSLCKTRDDMRGPHSWYWGALR